MEPKLIIQGFYGEGNLGDEAILQSILYQLDTFSGHKLAIFCRNPQQVSEMYGVKSIQSQGKGFIGVAKTVWELKTADLFLLGGGGLLKDFGNDSSSLKGWLRLLRLSQQLKIKTALCCIGVENIRYSSSKKMLKEVLEKVDLITVRDEISQDILKEIGIRKPIKVAADPALLLAGGRPRHIKQVAASYRVIICIRHWFDKGFQIEEQQGNENFIRSVSKAADFLVKHFGAKIDFIPLRTTSYDDDSMAAKKVVSYMEHKANATVYADAPTVDEFIDIIDRSALIIGMRLHSLILGAASGIPIIGLAYMPKVTGFMKSLYQDKYCLDLKTITAEKLIALIEKTFDEYDVRSKKIIMETRRKKELLQGVLTELGGLVGLKRKGR